MQTTYKDKLATIRKGETALLDECLKRIHDCIAEYNGHLNFGNTNLLLVHDIPYIAINRGDAVPLYSADGYETIEDIAHWADICEDVVNCYNAGNILYCGNWNK